MMENVNGLSPELIVHPGETIKELLEDKGMTQEELATRTGYTPKHVSEIISGKKNISAKFANTLEYALGIPTEFWINLQGIYDKNIIELEKANNISSKEYDILEQLKDIVAYCNDIKIFQHTTNKSVTILNLRKFLNVNDLSYIEKLPIKQVAFRASKKNTVNIYVLYAWQKICEYLTNDIILDDKFNKDMLKNKYDEIKSTMFLEANEMIRKLKLIFKECGIVFEVVKHFTGAPVQGFIKKNKDNIIMCLTIRQAFSDIFWFTLFHEIGHLVNDDFEDIYIDIDNKFSDNLKEQKADKFARNILINEKEYNDFIENNNINIISVRNFAKTQNVLPGIVIGRIQNDQNNYSLLTKYKEKYAWKN